MIVVHAFADLGCRLGDGVHDLPINEIHLEIGERRGFFDGGEAGDQGRELVELNPRDAEILDGAERLNPVQRADRYVALSEQVTLAARWPGEIDARALRRFETQPSDAGRGWGFHA